MIIICLCRWKQLGHVPRHWLLMAVLINGRKSKALNIDYDPKAKTLNFSPPDVELYLGP